MILRDFLSGMTFGEELRRKYELTSLKTKGGSLAVLAINETLETATRIAEEEHAPIIALASVI
jgi:hypothetical protein